MQSLISVIVPVYNAEDRLGKCVQSILSQTYTNIELILVDDGSTDNSLSLCRNYAQNDSRVIVVHQNNQGVSAARNQGIALSKGDWVAFVDADDYLSDDYLSKLSLKADDNQIVISGCNKVSFQGDIEYSHKIFQPATLTLANVAHAKIWDDILLFGTPWGKLFESKVIKENNISFPIGYQLHEDHQFYFDVLIHATKISTIAYAGYYYVNSGAGSLSRRRIIPTQQKSDAYITLSAKFKLITEKYGLKELYLPQSRNFIIRLYISALILSYRKENRKTEKPLYPSHGLRCQIAHSHIPTSLEGHIIKFILIYFPDYLQRIILKNIIK